VGGVEPKPIFQLTGGVVAYNEERRIAAAVGSLLNQELPAGARWGTIWVVASGCTDGTVEVARALAAQHPEVRVLVQPERRGKASALREIFRIARGDFLVLLNADAVARPGAVAALLRTASGMEVPFAVMGRPDPAELPPKGWGTGIQLLWNLHHRLHAELITTEKGSHLSDELLLLPVSNLPTLPEDIVNDGAFIGAWLRSHGGRLAYAVDARVAIEVPWSFADHLRQRRRIHAGHRQVSELVGVPPTTMGQYLTQRPGRALALLAAEVRDTPGGRLALAWLLTGEVAAAAAAVWDRVPPRRSHRLWVPIREPNGFPPTYGPRVGRTSASPTPSDRAG
jgi:hypothetical protein